MSKFTRKTVISKSNVKSDVSNDVSKIDVDVLDENIKVLKTSMFFAHRCRMPSTPIPYYYCTGFAAAGIRVHKICRHRRPNVHCAKIIFL